MSRGSKFDNGNCYHINQIDFVYIHAYKRYLRYYITISYLSCINWLVHKYLNVNSVNFILTYSKFTNNRKML